MILKKNYIFASLVVTSHYYLIILTCNKTKKEPHECQSIADVRNEIDTIDHEIVTLLGQRFKYVKEVVKYKEKTPESIIAADRREAVIKQRRIWADENGLNADMIEKLYRDLIQHFIDEEMKIVNIEPNK